MGENVSQLDGEAQKFYYRKSTASEKQPLLISLHTWNSGYEQYSFSLASYVQQADWNYIHPDFRGKNNHPKACCSQYVLDDLETAIQWAIDNLNVDRDRIYVVGMSGGAYAGMCLMMKSKHPIKTFSLWGGISDLVSWYQTSKLLKNKYPDRLRACTDSEGSSLDIEKAKNRSPFFWQTPVERIEQTSVKLYAGIHDGKGGKASVPFVQSVKFFNKLVKAIKGRFSKHVIGTSEFESLVVNRDKDIQNVGQLGDRSLRYHKKVGNVELYLFEGAHEFLDQAAWESLK